MGHLRQDPSHLGEVLATPQATSLTLLSVSHHSQAGTETLGSFHRTQKGSRFGIQPSLQIPFLLVPPPSGAHPPLAFCPLSHLPLQCGCQAGCWELETGVTLQAGGGRSAFQDTDIKNPGIPTHSHRLVCLLNRRGIAETEERKTGLQRRNFILMTSFIICFFN